MHVLTNEKFRAALAQEALGSTDPSVLDRILCDLTCLCRLGDLDPRLDLFYIQAEGRLRALERGWPLVDLPALRPRQRCEADRLSRAARGDFGQAMQRQRFYALARQRIFDLLHPTAASHVLRAVGRPGCVSVGCYGEVQGLCITSHGRGHGLATLTSPSGNRDMGLAALAQIDSLPGCDAARAM